MTPELEFLAKIMPSLIELGVSLFARHSGDAPSARRDIADRRRQIESLRAARDLEIAEKRK